MLQIRNERIVKLAAKLAAIRRSTKTEAVRLALENELAASRAKDARGAREAHPGPHRQSAGDRP